MVLDIFSRFVVAFTVAAREDSEIAKNMLEQAMGIHGIPDAIHADRGTWMTSKPVAQLLLDLGVARSHSRPHVSNDNPHSEAAFKTLKYAPAFPDQFGSLADARASAGTRCGASTRSRIDPQGVVTGAGPPLGSRCARVQMATGPRRDERGRRGRVRRRRRPQVPLPGAQGPWVDLARYDPGGALTAEVGEGRACST